MTSLPAEMGKVSYVAIRNVDIDEAAIIYYLSKFI